MLQTIPAGVDPPLAATHTRPQPGATFAALHHRNFRLMWLSLLVSNSGTWLQAVAQDFLVYNLTGRAVDLGLVSLARAVALISLSFLGGTIADRLDKRKLVLVTQTLFAAAAVTLGVLVQTGRIQVWHVVALSFVNATLLAVDQPARQSLLPHLVPREDLMNAIALNSITYTGAAALGPALAGPIIGAVGMAWGFYLNALSFLSVMWAVWTLQLPPHLPRAQSEPVLSAIGSGLRYITSSPVILLLVSLLTVVSFFAVPYQSLLPVFATRVFHGDYRELGYLRAAPGIGALAGGFLLARFAVFPHKGWLMLGGALGFSASLLAFAFMEWMPAALALLMATGLMFTVFQSTVQTLMQQLTADDMRGRVMSLFTISAIGMWPLGAWPMGWAADRFGVTAAVAGGVVVAGTYALAVTAGAGRMLGRLRA